MISSRGALSEEIETLVHRHPSKLSVGSPLSTIFSNFLFGKLKLDKHASPLNIASSFIFMQIEIFTSQNRGYRAETAVVTY